MGFKLGTRRIATGVALFSTAATTQLSAEPDKVQYELQERCAKAAAAAFKSDNPDGPIINTEDGQSMARYENHYSANLNKCFALYVITIYHVKSEPKYSATSMTIFDVNDNKEYGSYLGSSINNFPPMCVVQSKLCHSESEWRELVQPFMEN